jgi:hypothetical protein
MNAAWWSALETFEKTFWIIAIPATLAFFIQLVLTFFGADADADFDMDMDAEMHIDGGAGFQFFTLKNLVAFFTIFSWTGIACIHNGLGQTATVIIAVFCGLLMMAIMTSLFYFMSKLAQSGTLELKNALNHVGEVYLTIPKSKEGFGKVQIKIQGALRELEAMTADDNELKTGTLIKVIEVTSNNILIVTKHN